MVWYFIVTVFLTSPTADGVELLHKFTTQAACVESQGQVFLTSLTAQVKYSMTVGACKTGAFYE